MKIFYLAPYFPYPITSGGQMRTLQFLKFLSERGLVTFMSPIQEAEKKYEGLLMEHCDEWMPVDANRWGPHSKDGTRLSLTDRLLRIMRMVPWAVSDFISEEFKKQLLEVKWERYDLIFIRYPLLAYYFFNEPRLRDCCGRLVIDVDDILIQMHERRMREMRFGYTALRHWLELFFLKRYTKNLRNVKACLVTSQPDQKYLMRGGYSKRVFVLPNGWEIDQNAAAAPLPDSNEILFCGLLSFPHNEDAVLHFCDHIFPKIKKELPDAHFSIVGKSPTYRIKKYGDRAGVTVVGEVPSTKPYYERASLVVVPLLNGAGTRLKILEAMAYERPIVSTSIGAEGLEVTDQVNIAIADDASCFADHCVELLRNEKKRKLIAANARQLLKEKYSFQVLRKQFYLILDSLKQAQLPQPLLDLSIVICTYNRAQSLRETLESLRNQVVPKGVEYEVLVVDNNSVDETKQTVERVNFSGARKIEIRYFFEPRQGVAYARNRGIANAKGEIIAFLDDDVLADEGWIDALWQCFQETDAVAVAGRVERLWQCEQPSWLTEEISAPLIKQDLGTARTRWEHRNRHMVGANVGFRRSVFEKVGLFRKELGRKGDRLIGGEDREIFQRLFERGIPIYYEPKALVFHKVEKERVSQGYMRRWFWEVGKTLGHQIDWKAHYALTIAPLWVWKNVISALFRWIRARWTRMAPEAERFASEMWVRHHTGIFLERFFHWLPFGWGRQECVFGGSSNG